MQSFYTGDNHLLSLLDLSFIQRSLPAFPVHEHGSRRVESAPGYRDHPDHRLSPRLLSPAVGADDGGDDEDEEGGECQGHTDDQAPVDIEHRVAHQDHRANDEGGDAPRREQAVGGGEHLGHEQPEAEQHQQQAGVVHR